MMFKHLQDFRQTLYNSLGNARDALFDLMDAVLVSGCILSFVSLSQSPVFRRQWSSTYAALHDGRLRRAKVFKVLVQEIPKVGQPVLAGDVSDWKRPSAKHLKDRTFSGGSGKAVSVGHRYSTLAWIPEGSGSWALPLRHERLTSFETAASKAAFQLKQVVRHLGVRPLGVYDRGYGNASFVNQTAGIETDLLLRLASNRCVYGAPPVYKGRGAPMKHGHKMTLNDPLTWASPTECQEVEHPKLGRVRLTRWSQYHFQKSPKRPMEILRVEVVEPPPGKKRALPPLWLAWLGQTMLPLETLWLSYLRRFALEHWYRFAKQRLYWTQPQFSSVQATERWSALMPWLTWQLWLARSECRDHPLPWQSAQEKLSPGRVAQAFASILAAIGTPAVAPKPRGKSPGRAPGHHPPARIGYPTVKKRVSKQKKSEQSLSPPTAATA
ncbi:NF041680 family putative transposase [Leptolyngbya sp. AN02str]|uniref:NF041680 family putative transposase n=1 Tax=Leptolyngbya sp. AN02str TaxID=3423363 RepID=UPI003D32215E